jgi:Flp pilus assembly secretin CpaC
MTTHATEGQFFVGNTVPYVTSSYYGGSSLYGPSSSYQQLRVGIELTVTPFINPDGIVVMRIDQRIEEIDGATRIEGVGDVPNTASRTLSADITVKDRDTIVLGGFIRTSDSKNKAGVPLLKDIPVFGALFRSTSNDKDRRELLVLMRPTVLKTPELAAMGSKIERERMTGINKFEKKIEKENAEFDQEMDRLDGVKRGESAKETSEQLDPETQEFLDALYATPVPKETGGQPSAPAPAPAPAPAAVQPPPTPAPAPAPVAPAPAPAPSASATPPAAQSSDWTQPAASATPAKKQPAKPADPFKTTQPMTEEELKAFGRD